MINKGSGSRRIYLVVALEPEVRGLVGIWRRIPSDVTIVVLSRPGLQVENATTADVSLDIQSDLHADAEVLCPICRFGLRQTYGCGTGQHDRPTSTNRMG